MSPHLNTNVWFRHTSTGTLQRKRVCKEAAAHFPVELRKIYQKARTLGLLGHLIQAHDWDLITAWRQIKVYFNEKPLPARSHARKSGVQVK